ncbi:uncharacterized protein LOC121368175 [Gigantopelta aegis]|uniref:uncharacterized protein LOC121368175 n=1 Tax=Gigantopelta aegis TaxID=1735272 RepID=UPI001B88C82E|nr:uncharacterized protein LOC121368175 [Gigantopelta aegis]XP_041348732.1 uncharacterized protein LOC121368175 [Gigantopelta aegis]
MTTKPRVSRLGGVARIFANSIKDFTEKPEVRVGTPKKDKNSNKSKSPSPHGYNLNENSLPLFDDPGDGINEKHCFVPLEKDKKHKSNISPSKDIQSCESIKTSAQPKMSDESILIEQSKTDEIIFKKKTDIMCDSVKRNLSCKLPHKIADEPKESPFPAVSSKTFKTTYCLTRCSSNHETKEVNTVCKNTSCKKPFGEEDWTSDLLDPNVVESAYSDNKLTVSSMAFGPYDYTNNGMRFLSTARMSENIATTSEDQNHDFPKKECTSNSKHATKENGGHQCKSDSFPTYNSSDASDMTICEQHLSESKIQADTHKCDKTPSFQSKRFTHQRRRIHSSSACESPRYQSGNGDDTTKDTKDLPEGQINQGEIETQQIVYTKLNGHSHSASLKVNPNIRNSVGNKKITGGLHSQKTDYVEIEKSNGGNMKSQMNAVNCKKSSSDVLTKRTVEQISTSDKSVLHTCNSYSVGDINDDKTSSQQFLDSLTGGSSSKSNGDDDDDKASNVPCKTRIVRKRGRNRSLKDMFEEHEESEPTNTSEIPKFSVEKCNDNHVHSLLNKKCMKTDVIDKAKGVEKDSKVQNDLACLYEDWSDEPINTSSPRVKILSSVPDYLDFKDNNTESQTDSASNFYSSEASSTYSSEDEDGLYAICSQEDDSIEAIRYIKLPHSPKTRESEHSSLGSPKHVYGVPVDQDRDLVHLSSTVQQQLGNPGSILRNVCEYEIDDGGDYSDSEVFYANCKTVKPTFSTSEHPKTVTGNLELTKHSLSSNNLSFSNHDACDSPNDSSSSIQTSGTDSSAATHADIFEHGSLGCIQPQKCFPQYKCHQDHTYNHKLLSKLDLSIPLKDIRSKESHERMLEYVKNALVNISESHSDVNKDGKVLLRTVYNGESYNLDVGIVGHGASLCPFSDSDVSSNFQIEESTCHDQTCADCTKHDKMEKQNIFDTAHQPGQDADRNWPSQGLGLQRNQQHQVNDYDSGDSWKGQVVPCLQNDGAGEKYERKFVDHDKYSKLLSHVSSGEEGKICKNDMVAADKNMKSEVPSYIQYEDEINSHKQGTIVDNIGDISIKPSHRKCEETSTIKRNGKKQDCNQEVFADGYNNHVYSPVHPSKHWRSLYQREDINANGFSRDEPPCAETSRLNTDSFAKRIWCKAVPGKHRSNTETTPAAKMSYIDNAVKAIGPIDGNTNWMGSGESSGTSQVKTGIKEPSHCPNCSSCIRCKQKHILVLGKKPLENTGEERNQHDPTGTACLEKNNLPVQLDYRNNIYNYGWPYPFWLGQSCPPCETPMYMYPGMPQWMYPYSYSYQNNHSEDLPDRSEPALRSTFAPPDTHLTLQSVPPAHLSENSNLRETESPNYNCPRLPEMRRTPTIENKGKPLQRRFRESKDRYQLTSTPKNTEPSMSKSSGCRKLLNSSADSITSPTFDWKERFKRKYFNFPVPFIDSHCHLDLLFERSGFTGTFDEYKQLHQDTFPENFFGCVAIFCNPASFVPEGGLWQYLAMDYKSNVYLAMGCHPKNADKFNSVSYKNLKACLQHPRVVALGEIGLDYSGTFYQHEVEQKTVFIQQLNLALEVGKPIVIHCRDAEDDCLEIMQRIVPRNYKIHCHCFTGNYTSCKKWLNMFPNLYVGLTPVITYNTAKPAQEVAEFIPLERLLLETDAPYFVPNGVPRSRQHVSHPGMAITVAVEVANLRDVPVSMVLAHCYRNTKTLYGI